MPYLIGKILSNTNKQQKLTGEHRRRPTQARSKKRVDAILSAAKCLISEKGSAQLKIHDIAERAEVTPASIYQYFPSKNAITMALAQDTFDKAFSSLSDNLPTSTTKFDACVVLQSLVEEYYQAYMNDPAMLDIWVSVSADKSMQDLDIQDSRRQAELIFECIKQFYDQVLWDRLLQVSFLLSHMAGSAVRMALSVGPSEGRDLIDSFKRLINPASIDSMLQGDIDQ
jgi:AcrR family transcriptional regulator